MRKFALPLVFFIAAIQLATPIFSQCLPFTPLAVINPSFEGPFGAHITPAPWSTCGITPDTQPGSWGINLPPSNGTSYVGFVNGGPTWLEGASQQLSGNMVAGLVYTISMDLAISGPGAQGGINSAPTWLNIYGSNALCQGVELLWTSPVISNSGNWLTFTATFTPTQDWSFLYFQIGNNTPMMSYILLDNVTQITTSLPFIQITSHIDGANTLCSFPISGTISAPVADSIVLTGNFTGSPMLASLLGTNWNANLNFNGGGPQTVTARLYYTDPVTGATTCTFDNVQLNVNSPTSQFTTTNSCLNTVSTFTNTSTALPGSTLTGSTWNFGDGTSSSNTSPTHTYAAAGTYTVTLSVNASDGCNATISQQITIHPIPVISFTSPSQCEGNLTNFTNTSSVSTGTFTNFSWNFGDNSTSGLINPSHSYIDGGLYTVTLTGTTNNNCTASVQSLQEVFFKPIPTFLVTNKCQYDALEFMNTSTGPNDLNTWSFGDATLPVNISGNLNPLVTHNYNSSGQYQVELLTISTNGCKDSITQTAIAYSIPIANYSVSNVCFGNNSVFLDASTINPVANDIISQWNWTNGDGTSANNQINSRIYAAENMYPSQLIIASNFGCLDTFNVPVTVWPLPEVSFVAPAVCLNFVSVFNDLSTISNLHTSNSNVNWAWNFGDGSTANVQNTNHTYLNDGTFQVSLQVTSNNGCVNSATNPIIIHPKPIANFLIVNKCQYDALEFTNTTTGPNDMNSWNFGDATPAINIPGNPSLNPMNTHNYSLSGQYQVELLTVSINGCKDSITQTAIAYSVPNADYTFDNVCFGFTSFFQDASSINPVANDVILAWDWTLGDGTIVANQNTSHLYNTDGTFQVTLQTTTNYGCVDSETKPVVVYPNPVASFTVVNKCQYDALEFMNTSTGPNDLNIWNYGDATPLATIPLSLSNIPNTHNYVTSGQYQVELLTISTNGCRDSVTQTAIAYSIPTAIYSVANVCLGNPSVYQESASIIPVANDVISQWSWTNGDGTVGNLQTNSRIYAAENIYASQLIVSTNFGCLDTFSIPATVWPLPTVNFTAPAVCLNFQTDFTDNSTISNVHTANSNVNWVWNFGDGNTTISQNTNHTYTSDGTFQAILTVTSNHGCINALTKAVIVHPKPVADFSGFNLQGCSPLCPVISSNSTINAPSWISNVDWRLSNGMSHNGNSLTMCLENNSDSTEQYDLEMKLISNEGCKDTILFENYISVYHNPIASFTYLPVNPDIHNNVVQFTNTSLYAGIANWTFTDQPSSSSDSPEITFPDAPASYQIILVASTEQGCIDSASAIIRIKDVLVYFVPNTFTPDGDEFNNQFKPIFTSGYDPKSYTLLIFNRWGEQVFESGDTNEGWDGTYNGKTAIDGIYTWKLAFKFSENDERFDAVGHVNLMR